MSATPKTKSSRLKVGDWVEVRSKDEILRTLDNDGRLDGMPFMPEMFAFCGKRFQVYKRAHKTCDTVFPVRGRRVSQAVHLETRCDGGAHGGCQASCLLFWKDAWLRPLLHASPIFVQTQVDDGTNSTAAQSVQCRESTVWAKTQSNSSSGDPLYVCQATQLPYATSSLEWWQVSQYLEDYFSGNVGLWRIICGAVYFPFYAISRSSRTMGRLMRGFYDAFHPLWRGFPFPRRHGTIPEGDPTPVGTLGLQPGELVQIKPYKKILDTLNTQDRNRGLYFDAEEVPYCGGQYRILKRVTKIIHEKTGKMLEMKTPCFILDSVVCESRYSECRLFCPRSIYSYWREIWLERVGPVKSASNPIAESAVSRRETASNRQ